MKTSLTLFAILIILLTACDSNDTKTSDAASRDTATSATIPAKDTPAVTSSQKESVIPPEESDSLKFCYIKRFYKEGNALFIDADYIQFLYGKKAVEAARKHNDAEMEVKNGDTTYYVLNDYYVLNENTRIRKLTLSPDVSCYTISYEEPRVVLEKASLQKLESNYNKNNDNYYILTLDKNNVVTSIKEQYVP